MHGSIVTLDHFDTLAENYQLNAPASTLIVSRC